MEPTLSANEGLIALLWPRARPGQLRVFEHPQRPNFWLVKRVASVDGGEMVVDPPDRDRVIVAVDRDRLNHFLRPCNPAEAQSRQRKRL